MIVGALAAITGSVSPASILTFNIGGTEFSNSGAASIASNAIVLTLDDFNSSGTVRLTVTFNGGSGVDATARLNDLGLNLDPAKSITGFAWVSGVTVTTGSPSSSQNAYNLDGSHGYDVLFDYRPPGGQGDFAPGLTSVYDMTGAGLTAASFNFTNDSGKGPYRVAVHINAVNNNGNSGHYTESNAPPWTSIPEPGSLSVWGLGLVLSGLAVARRRRRR